MKKDNNALTAEDRIKKFRDKNIIPNREGLRDGDVAMLMEQHLLEVLETVVKSSFSAGCLCATDSEPKYKTWEEYFKNEVEPKYKIK